MVGKTDHVHKVPQWYGETIGFWDGTTLVAGPRTSRVGGCRRDVRDQRQPGDIETFKPALDAGGTFIGLDHETIFYDPEPSSRRSAPGSASPGGRRLTIPLAGIRSSSA